ncbi:MAG TPA: GNAT family N-acetyltransferase [Aliidongia sp.]|uniref:GNAT family N-acetyltransferase n=1 Tax=Aliidongia sp. TaxID=1914230 RepID=UPI002DDCA1BB|nr:GNAT family N-acetyltransferase [Aliidongia sp.]HEV2673182.1 GNAT family N-acetyltransferase [Aliidongia sp.]
MTEITIRGYDGADLEAAIDLFLLPKCIWGTLRLPHDSRDAIRKRLESIDPSRHRLVAVADGRVVGLLSLHRGEGRRAHAGEIALLVHDDFHGRGIGRKLTEACIDLAENWLGLTRIELGVFVDNAPAIALYGKCGFEIEGTERRWALRGGVLVDAHRMARVKP